VYFIFFLGEGECREMVFFVTLLAGIATLVKFVVIYCIGSSHVKGRFG
jgi:hypothetical protein